MKKTRINFQKEKGIRLTVMLIFRVEVRFSPKTIQNYFF